MHKRKVIHNRAPNTNNHNRTSTTHRTHSRANTRLHTGTLKNRLWSEVLIRAKEFLDCAYVSFRTQLRVHLIGDAAGDKLWRMPDDAARYL